MKASITSYSLCFFLLLIFCGTQLFAQQNWRWQNPLPQGNLLRGSAAPDTNVILMVGDAGTILKSKDGGQNWTRQNSGTRQDLYAVSFFNGDCGMVAGTDGTILRTKDCGDTWTKLGTGRNDTLRGISMLSLKLIIAVGDTGTILKSFDGGDNWVFQPIPGFPNINDVSFPIGGGGFGVFVGDSFPPFGGPPIYTSNDSGVSFTPYGGSVPGLSSMSINAVWVDKADPNKAVLVGDKGKIVATSDKGTVWEQPITPVTVPITDVFFFDGDNGFASGPEGTILRTKDCGKSWVLITPPDQKDFITVIFPQDSTGYFGGGEGTIYKTPDGGASFQPLSPGFRSFLTDVTFLDDSFGIAVGGQGAIVRTPNAGEDWIEVPPVTFDDLESVTSADGHALLAGGNFGSFGRIYHSGDSGISWFPQPVFALQKFFDITFLDSLRGFAVGLGGTVFCTIDGGANWTAKISGSTNWLLDATITNDSSAYIVGGFGTILRTTDFGNNWTPQSSGTQEWLTSVSFLDDSFGIATGNHGVILRTKDAGANWDKVSPPNITFDFTQVSLMRRLGAANKNGEGDIAVTAVGYGGTIVYSPDFGDNWYAQDSKTNHPLISCFFSDSATGTAVGHYGTILRTDSLGEIISTDLEEISSEAWQIESLLGLNYPNPFRSSTRIPFRVPFSAPVDLRIFDLQGREVDRLIREELAPGSYEYDWVPQSQPPGIYVYRLQLGHRSYSRKLILQQ